ncbi:MAG: hypothetical protein JOZ40_09085 [Methylobacteriaceae bacterium]|nr:hypothetical protein [Methylobacteriaceae bacterium]
MFRIFGAFVIVLVCLPDFGDRASAAELPNLTRTVIAGRPTKVDFSMQLNPDCTSIGPVDVRVVASPRAGQLSLRMGRDFPFYQSSNLRSACNARSVASTQVWYQSAREYAGQDYISFEYIFANGNTLKKDITLTIVP